GTAVLLGTGIVDLLEVAANERMRAPVWVLGTLGHAIFRPDAPVGPRMVGHEALERVAVFALLDLPRVRATQLADSVGSRCILHGRLPIGTSCRQSHCRRRR